MLYSTAVSYYKAQNRLHHHNLLAAEQTDRSKITSDRANLRIEDKFTIAQQSTLAQLRTGTCNSMGWYVGTDMTAITKMMFAVVRCSS